ncbi:MAG: glycoside hydrolase family 2 TIM barrel-domain containing protein [Candidatus Omnitrophota bacterium]
MKIRRYSILDTRYSIIYLLTFFLLASSIWHLASSHAEVLPSTEYVRNAWDASSKKDLESLEKIVNTCIENYSEEALEQQASLHALATKDKAQDYPALNDVATCYFIRGEANFKAGKLKEAKVDLKEVIDNYHYAQAWDPRGWFWSVAEKSQAILDKIKVMEEGELTPGNLETRPLERPATKLTLYDSGKESVVNYEKYGKFIGRGSKDYKYEITDQEGLVQAVGEGIYPNTTSVRWDPNFRKAMKAGRLEGSHWDFVYTPDLEANFYKWATASEPEGVKLFYIGLALERAGFIEHAIKAYYAIVVHFPASYGWTYWQTPWYVGPAAIGKIKYLTFRYPKLGIKLEGAKVRIINAFDKNISNDLVIADPGKLVKKTMLDKVSLAQTSEKIKVKVVKKIGGTRIKLVQFDNRHWRLYVNSKPYIIKGISYAPTKVGQSPDDGSLSNWMDYDYNHNGLCDGPFDSFIDKNLNNKQDKDEFPIGDFQLMKNMGVNTIRVYHQPFTFTKANKKLLRKLYDDFGIMVIMGDFLGKYAIGSGASWYEGTDYENPEHQKNMLDSVIKMVNEFKDEPYILMWLLGNENVYGIACNADKKPQAFFAFCDKVAEEIKKIDQEHPIGIANGDTLFLDKFAKYAPHVDIFAANAYRGGFGFSDFWQSVLFEADKPTFITEFGCPAFAANLSTEEAERGQSDYLEGAWYDIISNSAFRKEGFGNALGGVVFEWADEWWKAYEPAVHDSKGLFKGPFLDGFMYEEWLGVTSQGDGKLSPFLRQLRKSYYTLQRLWR